MSSRQTVVAPQRSDETTSQERTEPDRPWLLVVWDDPITLMTYVTWVFQKLFGYDRTTAEKLMLKVHNEGRAVVASGTREKAELDCFRLHSHGLWATISRSE